MDVRIQRAQNFIFPLCLSVAANHYYVCSIKMNCFNKSVDILYYLLLVVGDDAADKMRMSVMKRFHKLGKLLL